MKKKNPSIDFFATYLAMIRGALGANLFRHLIVQSEDGPMDILRDGEISCAVFVSSILALNGRIDCPHATVASTVRMMKEAGWSTVPRSSIQVGDVLVWGPQQSDPEQHTHIGFAIGEGKAISNSTNERVPIEHDLMFHGERALTDALRWPDWAMPGFPT